MEIRERALCLYTRGRKKFRSRFNCIRYYRGRRGGEGRKGEEGDRVEFVLHDHGRQKKGFSFGKKLRAAL